MKSIPKLVRRFAGVMLLSFVLLLILNVALLAIYGSDQEPNARPWKTAEQVAESLHQDEHGYKLSHSAAQELKKFRAWAIFIDNRTLKTLWKTDNVPETVPAAYSASDIADLTRGYIDGYPTFTGQGKEGLVVLGYPRDSFWKHMWPSWDYRFIEHLPATILTVLLMNGILIFLIYAVANSRLLQSVTPIVKGIQALPEKEPVFVREKGLLSELAVSINRTSSILQSQGRQIRKKDNARANWIAGVSHDIRTPLSMVMGYAGQLKEDVHLTDAQKKKASAIVKQSQRIQTLINDLNLASKLEYNMQPIHWKQENMVAIVRQAAVDFMNMDPEGRYPVEWKTDQDLTRCPVNADKDLIKRAAGNLLQNCMNHNQQGCTIYVSVRTERGRCTAVIEDNGVGASDEQIKTLNHAPHYMVCDQNTAEQRHGLGLLLVKQIAAAHGGRVVVRHSRYGGFSVQFSLPMEE